MKTLESIWSMPFFCTVVNILSIFLKLLELVNMCLIYKKVKLNVFLEGALNQMVPITSY